MQLQFSYLANLSSSIDGSPTIEEAAALYLDPRHRFLSSGPKLSPRQKPFPSSSVNVITT
jgi:hypothetical protein